MECARCSPRVMGCIMFVICSYVKLGLRAYPLKLRHDHAEALGLFDVKIFDGLGTGDRLLVRRNDAAKRLSGLAEDGHAQAIHRKSNIGQRPSTKKAASLGLAAVGVSLVGVSHFVSHTPQRSISHRKNENGNGTSLPPGP